MLKIFVDPGESARTTDRPQFRTPAVLPFYYLVRRGNGHGTLDRGLVQQASEAGVEVRFGQRHPSDEIRVVSSRPRAADVIAVGYLFRTKMPGGAWICFNRELAPLGYSYRLVHRGRGTVASCMFADFERKNHCLERTLEFFRGRVGLRMEEPRKFGAYGNYYLPGTAVQRGSLVLGERAGFQDPLAGFGIRYAMRLGIPAARSLLDGADDDSLWRRDLLDLLRTGLANRFLVNLTGDRGWRSILSRRLAGQDVGQAMRKLYRPRTLTRTLYPVTYLSHKLPRSKSRAAARVPPPAKIVAGEPPHRLES